MKLLHVAVHSGINQNAGDIMLCAATRRCFEHFLGPIDWTLRQAWEPFDAALANQHDGVIVGGGGMLLPDQEGANYEASGWQWNCTLDQLGAIRVPLIVFAIGYNRFRGQEEFDAPFPEHIARTAIKAHFFSLRERGGIDALWDEVDDHRFDDMLYQPCPTTCLWQLYPAYQSQPGGKVLGINIATDRACYRFQKPDTEARLYDALTSVARMAIDMGWEVCLLLHKPQDAELAGYLATARLPHRLLVLFDQSPERILETYHQMDCVIGMRGHAQLIPFGLRTPIISIISHDKLQWFLEDIGHTEWGVEVDDNVLANNLRILFGYQALASLPQRAKAQEHCWAITTQNMHRIARILGAEVTG